MATIEYHEFMRAAGDRDEGFFEMANQEVVRFDIGNSVSLELHQDTALHDCCGGIIWETSFCLATYLVRHLSSRFERPLKKVKVVELGAGCGLLGLTLACMECSVVLTDVAEVMPLLKGNIDRNKARLQVSESVTAMPLDWENSAELSSVCASGPYDVIVATDVVFAERLVQPLLDAIAALSGSSTIVWICIQERSPEAFKTFLDRVHIMFTAKRIAVSDIEFADEEVVLLEIVPSRNGEIQGRRVVEDGPREEVAACGTKTANSGELEKAIRKRARGLDESSSGHKSIRNKVKSGTKEKPKDNKP